jgi:hypothetical protein
MALGLGTIAMLLFFGMAVREAMPIAGFVLLGFAGLRAVLWILQLVQLLKPPPSAEEFEREFLDD